MRRFLILATLLFGMIGSAQAATIEQVSFPSITPQGPRTISQKIEAGMTHLTVTASLYMPDKANGPVPAMLVMHGSGGLKFDGEQVRSWAEQFASWGIAALVIDSFGPRGVVETATDQSKVPEWANVADAFNGLKLLANDPRIDRSHIGLIGFSRGGSVVLQTALESLRHGLIDDDLHFALHIAFYASCSYQYVDHATDQSPILFLHGEADDYTPIAACRDYAKWFEGEGNAVSFVAYPGVYHDFDHPRGKVVLDKNVVTALQCDGRYDIDRGRFVRLHGEDNPDASREQIETYIKSCRGKGAHLGPDPKARADSIEQVHALLKKQFAAQ